MRFTAVEAVPAEKPIVEDLFELAVFCVAADTLIWVLPVPVVGEYANILLAMVNRHLSLMSSFQMSQR